MTQQLFSGDGARVFTDLFDDGAIDVIYAEHFNMQQNMGNIPVWVALFAPGEKSDKKYKRNTDKKMHTVCANINAGVIKKRGFFTVAKWLGFIQGKPWQADTGDISAKRLEQKIAHGLQIHNDCTACNLCTKICPMQNLENRGGKIQHLNNCTICYRCLNRCPQKAITVYIHLKPKWQYNGMEQNHAND